MSSPPPAPGGQSKVTLPLPKLAKGGPEQQAIEAGEIDAIVDYASSNVILLPAAKRALREAAERAATANREPVANSLLAALPHVEYQRLLGSLEWIALKSGEVLHQPGVPIQYVYFPMDCVVCLLAAVEGHPPMAVALVGYEGMVGKALALGIETPCTRALVQASGAALRMEAALFRTEIAQSRPLQQALSRYEHALIEQLAQSAACNRFHPVAARLARYLLMTSDRARSRE